ncbi:MAG TPA: glutamine synthetase family protein [Chloroflexota bacterium]|nr:glutamine synthetase family protein [Chloroflexota bacterium]
MQAASVGVDEVLRAADAADVSLVRFLYCDNGSIIRGKSSHRAGLAERLRSGIGLTVAMQAMNALDQLQSVEGLGPVGEIRLVPDLDTFTVLPYAARQALAFVDMQTLDGAPWSACPRGFLRRAIAAARAAGFSVQAAFEPEWSLATRADDRYVPYDQSLCFSTLGMLTAAPVIGDVVDALVAQGLEVEQYYPELGHGQQELSIHHADALRAADNQLRYRETVRAVAWRHGLYASLAPKPWPDQAGNGAHLHWSLWDPDGARNLLHDPAQPFGLSALGRQFVAGVLDHLPGLVALTCPSFNSYHRLQPRSWSSAFTCYGPDNREAAVRLVSTYRGAEMASTNLELKPCDNSCNPYLALGGLIVAGLDGVQRGATLDEGRLALVDPALLSDDERAARGIRRLPASLGEALDALEADAVLMEALGDLLRRSYLAVRRSEWEAFSREDAAFEQQHHFFKY